MVCIFCEVVLQFVSQCFDGTFRLEWLLRAFMAFLKIEQIHSSHSLEFCTEEDQITAGKWAFCVIAWIPNALQEDVSETECAVCL